MIPAEQLLRSAVARLAAMCGWVAFRLGLRERARRQYERVLRLKGDDFAAYIHLGRIAYDNGDYAGWRREFAHARRADPGRFARLRQPFELFEPRLAGTTHEPVWGRDAAGGDPFGRDPFEGGQSRGNPGRERDPSGFDPFGLPLGAGRGRREDGVGAEPLGPTATGFRTENDDLGIDDLDDGFDSPGDRATWRSLHENPPVGEDATGSVEDRSFEDWDAEPAADWTAAFGEPAGRRQPRDDEPGRDDCRTPLERERFELLGPVAAAEIAACDLDELARRLGDGA